jgi:hypothetical protein
MGSRVAEAPANASSDDADATIDAVAQNPGPAAAVGKARPAGVIGRHRSGLNNGPGAVQGLPKPATSARAAKNDLSATVHGRTSAAHRDRRTRAR